MTPLIVVIALLGLAIGSFLNVVISRVPANESLVRPPSHCPACGRSDQKPAQHSVARLAAAPRSLRRLPRPDQRALSAGRNS